MVFNVAEVQEAFDLYELELMSSTDHLKGELSTIRAGRANPHILDKIVVDYYGTMTPVGQMANIVVPEARLLQISPWDASMVKEIVKAINASDVGITPTDDGKVIRLVFPQLTEERRRDLIKQVKKTGEDYKVTLRNERRDIVDTMRSLKKSNLITEDDLAGFEKEIQRMLDGAVGTVDAMVKAKEAEILEV
ncbi:MAG: ribosome recycling factor [Clostridiales bacterium]|jgi:ribosome recycling factor|nr:ribosome recycling factor [Clostridiales bacterium]